MASLRARLIEGALRASRLKRLFSDLGRFRWLVRHGGQGDGARPGRARERRLRIGLERFGGHPVWTVSPREGGGEGGGGPHILYLHGGAYVFPMAGLHWRGIEALIRRTGASVTVPLYPRAPGASCLDAFAMVRPLHAALARRHGAGRLVVAGDSAGGGMALALVQQIRDAGEELPGRVVMFSPWLDVTGRDPGQKALDAVDPFLPLGPGRLAGAWYAGDLPVDDPRVSPIFGPVAGLPPMAVFTGTHDVLNADAHRLRERAAREGAALAFHEAEAMLHVWMLMPIPEAGVALDAASDFMLGG